MNRAGKCLDKSLRASGRVDDVFAMRLARKWTSTNVRGQRRRVIYTKKIPTRWANWRDDEIGELLSEVL